MSPSWDAGFVFCIFPPFSLVDVLNGQTLVSVDEAFTRRSPIGPKGHPEASCGRAAVLGLQ
jgi:hypothetical protein